MTTNHDDVRNFFNNIAEVYNNAAIAHEQDKNFVKEYRETKAAEERGMGIAQIRRNRDRLMAEHQKALSQLGATRPPIIPHGMTSQDLLFAKQTVESRMKNGAELRELVQQAEEANDQVLMRVLLDELPVQEIRTREKFTEAVYGKIYAEQARRQDELNREIKNVKISAEFAEGGLGAGIKETWNLPSETPRHDYILPPEDAVLPPTPVTEAPKRTPSLTIKEIYYSEAREECAARFKVKK